MFCQHSHLPHGGCWHGHWLHGNSIRVVIEFPGNSGSVQYSPWQWEHRWQCSCWLHGHDKDYTDIESKFCWSFADLKETLRQNDVQYQVCCKFKRGFSTRAEVVCPHTWTVIVDFVHFTVHSFEYFTVHNLSLLKLNNFAKLFLHIY